MAERLLAVIGYPIKHSLSPVFQQAALDARGIGARYQMREVEPAALGSFVAETRVPRWMGFNVTIPHKEAILPLIDELSPTAGAIGAVNTVVNRERRLVGHNTDVSGFLGALRHEAGVNPRGKGAVMLGAGGAARAVARALADAGVANLVVMEPGQ